MRDDQLNYSRFTRPALPPALAHSEEAVRRELHARLQALCEDGRTFAVAAALGFAPLYREKPQNCRLGDLAAAVYRLENITSESRAELPPIILLDHDEHNRHLEMEFVGRAVSDEEKAILDLRKGSCSSAFR
jgi:hypothetical protein